MSRTDKTAPYRVAVARGDCERGECLGGYPCPHVSISGRLGPLKRRETRRARTALRVDLARGVDPATPQHRHRALWDAW